MVALAAGTTAVTSIPMDMESTPTHQCNHRATPPCSNAVPPWLLLQPTHHLQPPCLKYLQNSCNYSSLFPHHCCYGYYRCIHYPCHCLGFPPAQAPLQVQPSLLLNHPIPSLACYNTLQNKPATKSTEASQPTPALAPNPKLKDPITTKTRSTMICSFPSSYETTWRQQLFNASVSWISSNSSTLSIR